MGPPSGGGMCVCGVCVCVRARARVSQNPAPFSRCLDRAQPEAGAKATGKPQDKVSWASDPASPELGT